IGRDGTGHGYAHSSTLLIGLEANAWMGTARYRGAVGWPGAHTPWSGPDHPRHTSFRRDAVSRCRRRRGRSRLRRFLQRRGTVGALPRQVDVDTPEVSVGGG